MKRIDKVRAIAEKLMQYSFENRSRKEVALFKRYVYFLACKSLGFSGLKTAKSCGYTHGNVKAGIKKCEDYIEINYLPFMIVYDDFYHKLVSLGYLTQFNNNNQAFMYIDRKIKDYENEIKILQERKTKIESALK